MRRIGVLTGDIVASSRVPPRQRKAFVIHLERVVRGRAFPNLARVAGIMATQIFRGDAFQLAFDRPGRGSSAC